MPSNKIPNTYTDSSPLTMSLTVICTGIFVFYVIIWFFDSFFKSCMHYPYYTFLEGTGLKIGFFHFSWKTQAFNRLIFRWGKRASYFLKKWFSFGYIFAIFIFLPFAVWVLASTVISNLWVHDGAKGSSPEVKTIIPGVNIPTGDFWAYFIALGVSSVIHELGHAIAAVQGDVQLLNVGFYVFAFIPIAFVELNTDHMNAVSVKRRLRIYCAGVWHNIVCGVLAALLFSSVSLVFNFGYRVGSGVRVAEFRPDSPLVGSRGLEYGDHVTGINGCQVKNNNDWHSCLYTTTAERFGLCVTSEFVSNNDEIVVVTYKENDLVNCCREEDEQSLCFEYIEPKHGEVTLAGQYSCLKPREIIKEQFIKCTNTFEHLCPDDQHCLKPLLGNATHLFVIDRLNKDTVLYIGSPYDLSYTVLVDHYIPKYEVLSVFSPQSIEKMLQYIFMFSMGIGIVNIIPCFGTDGHHIARNVLQVIARWLKKDVEFVNVMTFCVVVLGTIATIPSLTYLFIKTIMNAH